MIAKKQIEYLDPTVPGTIDSDGGGDGGGGKQGEKRGGEEKGEGRGRGSHRSRASYYMVLGAIICRGCDTWA